MHEASLDDARASDPAERLLEDSWDGRSRRVSRRELAAEALAAAAFLACAVPLAVAALGAHDIDLRFTVLLVGLYALVSRVEFPVGVGHVVPSYLVLAPMLLLLPAGAVPLLVSSGLVLGALGQWAARRTGPERVLFAIPDAWHAIGPALVLVLAGDHVHGAWAPLVYIAAFFAGCVFDLMSATLREAAALEIAPSLQVRVLALVWLVDACLAPVGMLAALAARHDPVLIVLILPLNGLLMLLARDRNVRIAQAQSRLDLVARERTRLQAAVGRLGDAFAAKLDLDHLVDIVLRGSIEALDADGGRLTLSGPGHPRAIEIATVPDVVAALEEAGATAQAGNCPQRLERDGTWALALPFSFGSDDEQIQGALTVARRDREFREDEEALMLGLVERARQAAADILSHEAVRQQAVTDPLTQLGNRRMLAVDLATRLGDASTDEPVVLMLFDLDGFKTYNDTFGHLAGDALLARLGGKLAAAVADHGAAYRLGGDEFCVLVSAPSHRLDAIVASAADALHERGDTFVIGASYGAVVLPHEAATADYALQLADERMYARKQGRGSGADATAARDLLMRIMQAKQPGLHEHSSEVAHLAARVGRRFGMSAEEIDELARAAELHDIGKVGVPDAILDKPGSLDASEWEFVRQHTVLGERILSAAPALRPVAVIVRSSHERWDGAGYPDGLAGADIPLGARIVAVCDAYESMISDRCYRAASGHDAACAELLREAGQQFDPAVVDVFLAELKDLAENGADPLSPVYDPRAQTAKEVAAHLTAVFARHAATPRDLDENPLAEAC